MVLMRKRLEQWVEAVAAWLRTGWKTPGAALKWEQIYPLVVLAVLVFLAVRLTPTLQTWGQNLITAIGQALQNIFSFTLG